MCCSFMCTVSCVCTPLTPISNFDQNTSRSTGHYENFFDGVMFYYYLIGLVTKRISIANFRLSKICHCQWSRTYRFFGISTDMGSVLPKYRNITIFLRFHSIYGNSPDFSTDFTLLSWQPFSCMFNVTGKPSN